MTEFQPIVRIVLRYLAMYLMTSGYLSADTGAAILDPATLTAITGVIVAIGTEVWYRLAKQKGGAT